MFNCTITWVYRTQKVVYREQWSYFWCKSVMGQHSKIFWHCWCDKTNGQIVRHTQIWIVRPT